MGARRQYKVSVEWSPELAYAIGLITTDGNLSKDGRHVNFTSKDRELAANYRRCLKLSNVIGRKSRGGSTAKDYFVVQFGDMNFYEFLLRIGLTQAKSKTLGELLIPRKFFIHFLRGCIDGDGNISIARHPESQHPQLRVRLYSASLPFLHWIKSQIDSSVKTSGGWISTDNFARVMVLIYAKEDSLCILKRLYPLGLAQHLYLTRKFHIARHLFGRVAELV